MTTEDLTPETPPAVSPGPPKFALEKLSPEQVNIMWPAFQSAIKASLPPTEVTDDPAAMNNVLAAVMKGELQVWIATKRGEDSCYVYGGAVTQITGPSVTGVKNLWLYSLFIHELPPAPLVGVIVEALREYARANACKRMFGASNNEVILKLVVKHLGGNADYRLIEMEV